MLKSLALASAILGLAAASPAKASYQLDIRQVGPDVIASGSGSIDLTGLTFEGSFFPGDPGQINSSQAVVLIGMAPGESFYGGASGPSSFGSGGYVFADSNSGALVAICGLCGGLLVPEGYSSGADLGASSSIFTNATLASLGFIPGNYTWTWGQVSSDDSLTVRIGAAVPEPSTWAMMLLGFGGIGASMRWSKRARASAA